MAYFKLTQLMDVADGVPHFSLKQGDAADIQIQFFEEDGVTPHPYGNLFDGFDPHIKISTGPGNRPIFDEAMFPEDPDNGLATKAFTPDEPGTYFMEVVFVEDGGTRKKIYPRNGFLTVVVNPCL